MPAGNDDQRMLEVAQSNDVTEEPAQHLLLGTNPGCPAGNRDAMLAEANGRPHVLWL